MEVALFVLLLVRANREEFKAYGAQLRTKTAEYKRLKAELADLRAENVVLNRTEQILKSRDDKLEEFLQKLESDKVLHPSSS